MLLKWSRTNSNCESKNTYNIKPSRRKSQIVRMQITPTLIPSLFHRHLFPLCFKDLKLFAITAILVAQLPVLFPIFSPNAFGENFLNKVSSSPPPGYKCSTHVFITILVPLLVVYTTPGNVPGVGSSKLDLARLAIVIN